MNAPPAAIDEGWLPDFCRLPVLFSTLVAAQLVVLVIGLAPGAAPAWALDQWLAASALALWLALCSAVFLCKLRPSLHRLPRALAGALAWAVPVFVAFVGGLLIYRLERDLQIGVRSGERSALAFALSVAVITGLLAAALLRYFHFQQRWQQQIAAQARARADALQARIRPHFLFNSMNSIASLVRRDPRSAERAIEDLSDLFRAALGAGDAPGTLDEEIELCERFLAIEALRLGERLQVDWRIDADAPRAMALPRLLLQPLVENAVIHGIARLEQGGCISIRIHRQGERLRIVIGNPCPDVGEAHGNSHAQHSVRQRLDYAFGGRARMTVTPGQGYYACELLLPIDD
ncbi:MAG: histidine kinase [Lysobacteraceae bacterium]